VWSHFEILAVLYCKRVRSDDSYMEQSSSSCQHHELIGARVSRRASHPHFYPTCERVERGSMHGKIRDVSHFTDSLDQKYSCLAQASRAFSRAYQNSLSHANLPIYLANHATCASQRFLIIRHRKKMIRVTFRVEEVCIAALRGFEE
jgi:hypothetical protein